MKRNCRSGRVPSSSATKAEDGGGDAERQSFFSPRSAERRAGTTSDKGSVGAVRGPLGLPPSLQGFHCEEHKGKNECRDLKKERRRRKISEDSLCCAGAGGVAVRVATWPPPPPPPLTPLPPYPQCRVALW